MTICAPASCLNRAAMPTCTAPSSRPRTMQTSMSFFCTTRATAQCGHAIIALTKLVIEAGLIKNDRVSFNVPAGRIESTAVIEKGRVIQTAFRNVPSFLYRRDQSIDIPGLGNVQFDIAYGGAFYAMVEAQPLLLRL